MKESWGVGLVVIVLALTFILIVCFAPDRRGHRLPTGEGVFHGKPTSYWRNALKEEKRHSDWSRQIAREHHTEWMRDPSEPILWELQNGGADAVAVYYDLLKDEDPYIREIAKNLLQSVR
jgi:hypothetical protein